MLQLLHSCTLILMHTYIYDIPNALLYPCYYAHLYLQYTLTLITLTLYSRTLILMHIYTKDIFAHTYTYVILTCTYAYKVLMHTFTKQCCIKFNAVMQMWIHANRLIIHIYNVHTTSSRIISKCTCKQTLLYRALFRLHTNMLT